MSFEAMFQSDFAYCEAYVNSFRDIEDMYFLALRDINL